jgi:hypothetical protein
MAELYPLMSEVLASGGEFRLYPKGTSMLPLLREGRDSVVLVAKKALKKQDICLYRRKGGEFVLHRLVDLDKEGNPVFCGDNQTVREYGVPVESVLAVVSAFYRGEKRRSLKGLGYRLYVMAFRFLPVRRLLLKCYYLTLRFKKKKDR